MGQQRGLVPITERTLAGLAIGIQRAGILEISVFGQLERYSSDLEDSSVCKADDEEDFGQLDW